MKNRMFTLLALLFIVPMAFALIGCGSSGDGDTTNTNKTIGTEVPTHSDDGMIQGVLVDRCTLEPIVGAVLDIGFARATTTANGQFVFQNLPPTHNTDGEEERYTITGDLRKVTSPVNMAAATGTKYPQFKYGMVSLKGEQITLLTGAPFTDTTQTINTDPVFTGAGLAFIAKLAATIKGVVAYEATHQPVGANWTVELVSDGITNTAATAAVGGSGGKGNVVDTAVTDANGSFTFSNVEAFGEFTIHAWNTAHTFMTNATGVAVTAPSEFETLNLAIQEDSFLPDVTGAVFVNSTDNLAPVIIAVTPEQDADVVGGTTQDVVFTFSEPIKYNAYTNGISATDTYGMYSDVFVNFDKSKVAFGGNLPYTLAWNAGMDQLTVSITSTAPSSEYTVSLCGPSPFNAVDALDLTDRSDNDVTGLCDAGKGVVSFTTFGALSPDPPTVTITNLQSLDWMATPRLDWDPMSGAACYNVYRTKNLVWTAGTVGAKTPAVIVGPCVDVKLSEFTDTTGDDGVAGTADDGPVTMVHGGEVQKTFTYEVASVNMDEEESATLSVAKTAQDKVSPKLSTVAATLVTDLLDNDDTLTLQFNEPMVEATAEAAGNYTIALIAPANITVNGAAYDTTLRQVELTLSGDLDPADIKPVDIRTGPNGINDTNLVGDDAVTQIIPFGEGTPSSTCVSDSPANPGLQSAVTAGHDDIVTAIPSIHSGPNGICNTTAVAGDVQTLDVGNGTPNSLAFTAGANLTVNSTVVGSDDWVDTSAATVITVTTDTDVGGNVISTGGNNHASDGTVQ